MFKLCVAKLWSVDCDEMRRHELNLVQPDEYRFEWTLTLVVACSEGQCSFYLGKNLVFSGSMFVGGPFIGS